MKCPLCGVGLSLQKNPTIKPYLDGESNFVYCNFCKSVVLKERGEATPK